MFDLIEELFSHAGVIDFLSKSPTTGLVTEDSEKCPSNSKFKSIRLPE